MDTTQNNPGNIFFKSDEKWRGQITTKISPYAEFRHLSWGIRAIFVILESYVNVKLKNGDLNDVLGLGTVTRWLGYSPLSYAKSTEAFKTFERTLANVLSSDADIESYVTAKKLVESVIIMEQGEMIYTEKQINTGLARAGIDVPSSTLLSSRIIWGSITAGVSTALSATLDGTDFPFLLELLSIQYPEYFDITMNAVTVVAIFAVLWARIEDQDTRI